MASVLAATGALYMKRSAVHLMVRCCVPTQTLSLSLAFMMELMGSMVSQAETSLDRVWCISSAVAPHLRSSFELPKAARSDLDALKSVC